MDNRTADSVVQDLTALRIAHVAEWDVLAFIYHHGTSLASDEKIALLLGYTKVVVGSALDSLTSKGLVQRSRNSRGVRLYRFFFGAVPDDPLRRALQELLKIADDREGRLLLIKHLRQATAGKELRGSGGLHFA